MTICPFILLYLRLTLDRSIKVMVMHISIENSLSMVTDKANITIVIIIAPHICYWMVYLHSLTFDLIWIFFFKEFVIKCNGTMTVKFPTYLHQLAWLPPWSCSCYMLPENYNSGEISPVDNIKWMQSYATDDKQTEVANQSN